MVTTMQNRCVSQFKDLSNQKQRRVSLWEIFAINSISCRTAPMNCVFSAVGPSTWIFFMHAITQQCESEFQLVSCQMKLDEQMFESHREIVSFEEFPERCQ